MEIRSIEEKAYAQMKLAFEKFVREMKELCGDVRADKEWLDNQDVCELLNISKRTLQHYRDYGILPFSIIGKKCYYKISDIEKLLSDSITK